MFETNIVIVGNVLTAPEWRRTAGNHLVANFRVASTSRRFDRDAGRWVDGSHLRVRVNCWRRLAENVGASVMVGDPIVVVGRLHTRDWADAEGNPRTSYEMEAVAVGHDLARGKAKFFRSRPTAVVTSDSDDPETNAVVRGEAAELLPDDLIPAGYGEGLPEADEPEFEELAPGLDPVAAMIGRPAPAASGSDPAGEDLSPVADQDGVEIEVEAFDDEPEPGRRRSRRGAHREPVAA